jgi:hypothetical protein
MATTDEPELDIGSRLFYHAPLGSTLRCRVTGAIGPGIKLTFARADDYEDFTRWAARLSAFRPTGNPETPWEVDHTDCEVTDDARF